MARFAGMSYKEMIAAILHAGAGDSELRLEMERKWRSHENGNGTSHAQPVSNGTISVETNGQKPVEKTAKTLALNL